MRALFGKDQASRAKTERSLRDKDLCMRGVVVKRIHPGKCRQRDTGAKRIGGRSREISPCRSQSSVRCALDSAPEVSSMEPLNLADFEGLARTKLPRPALDYYAGGAGDNVTLRENEAAFQKIALRPRVLVGVGKRDLATRVLGAGVSMPVLVAPTAFHGLAHEDAERATARAAGKAGTVMVLSTLSNVAVEDVVTASSGPVWFQLYVYKDRAVTKDLVERAVAAGCRALVLTVDAPLLGRREADVRNGFHLPPGLEAKNLLPANLAKLGKTTGDSGLAAYFATLLDPDLSWKDVDWL